MMEAFLILSKALDLFIAGEMAAERLVAVNNRLKQMKAEGRDPTDAEFADEFAQIDADHARIIAADQRLNPED
jgi:hypothetical protein